MCFFHLPPPLLPSPILPRVSITVSLHLSLARAGRSFLMLMHTQRHKHTHKHRVEHPFQLKWSIVKCTTHTHTHTHTHTLLFLICSMLSSVNTVLQFPLVSVRATCVKGVSDKHHFPSIIHIHHFLSDSEHLTWNHRASRMIDGVNYRRLMFHFLSQGR